jgi:hypothetical protein
MKESSLSRRPMIVRRMRSRAAGSSGLVEIYSEGEAGWGVMDSVLVAVITSRCVSFNLIKLRPYFVVSSTIPAANKKSRIRE